MGEWPLVRGSGADEEVLATAVGKEAEVERDIRQQKRYEVSHNIEGKAGKNGGGGCSNVASATDVEEVND